MPTKANDAQDPRTDLLNKVFDDMIVKNFRRQPVWLQAFVYFLFVMFFMATAYRLVAGDYVVKGVMWDNGRLARNCEIRIGDGFFTSNSKGIYYVVLRPAEYWMLAATRSAKFPMVRREENEDRRLGDFVLPMRSWSLDEFEDFDISQRKEVVRVSPSPALNFDLIPSAYAQGFPTRADRLILNSIILAPSNTSRRAEFKLDTGVEDKSPLLISGTPVGDLPLRKSMTVTFDAGYYFELPLSRRGKKVEIELDDQSGKWWGTNEDFGFTAPAVPGTFSVRGTRGSLLTVTLIAAADPRTAVKK